MEARTKIRVRELLDEAIADGVTMGASVSVWQGGREIFYEARGYADREKKKPIERDTIFRLYSMSKPVTAAAAMILVERGVIDLAQPVADFLPGFRELTVDCDGVIEKTDVPVTVLQLMNMTSGLSYGGEATLSERMTSAYIDECVARLHTDHPVTTVELANHLGTLPLLFVPDTSWRYGLSADVLGAVIEVASGMRFGEFLQKELFDRLGMADTGFWVPGSKQDRLACAYESVGDGTMTPYTGDNLAVQNTMAEPPAYEAGGAGLVSTLPDYARFTQMLLNGGMLDGIRVLSETSVRFLTSGRLTDVQQREFRKWVGLEGFSYSHLMRVMQEPGMANLIGCTGEYGWDGWLGCYFTNIPEKNMTILLMQQKKDAGTIPMTRKIRNVILAGQ